MKHNCNHALGIRDSLPEGDVTQEKVIDKRGVTVDPGRVIFVSDGIKEEFINDWYFALFTYCPDCGEQLLKED